MNPLIRRDPCPHCDCTLPPTLEREERRPIGTTSIHQTIAVQYMRCKRCMGRYQLAEHGALIRDRASL